MALVGTHDSAGMQDLRKENVSKIVTGFALQSYVFKQLCIVENSNSWKETYFTEEAADLTAKGTRAVEGVSRLANFPYAEVGFTEKSNRLKKHAVEGLVSMEDAMTSEIDVMKRTMLRIGRAIAKSVDADIWDTITENQSASTINSLSIAAGSEWDSNTIANRDPIQNILDAKVLIEEQNYNANKGGHLCLNPKDFANIMGNANVRNAGQFFTDDVTRNGRVGRILGLTILVSTNVTADFAAIVVAKEACTWKTARALTINTIEDPGIKFTIRAFEIGVAQLKNPKAVTLIDNTAK